MSAMAANLFDTVKRIKSENEPLSRKIDALEADIRRKVVEIKALLDRFPAKDRDLVRVLIINGLHRTADETLLD